MFDGLQVPVIGHFDQLENSAEHFGAVEVLFGTRVVETQDPVALLKVFDLVSQTHYLRLVIMFLLF
jgi:hypothetical protein